MNNAHKSKEDSVKTKAQLSAKVVALRQELVSVKKAAEKAQGLFYYRLWCIYFL